LSSLRLTNGEQSIGSSEIRNAVEDLGLHYANRYDGEGVFAMPVLKGAKPFADDLVEEMTDNGLSVVVHDIQISSMKGDKSTGEAEWLLPPPDDVAGRNILLIEDIDDTRVTMGAIARALLGRGAKRVDIAILLNKKHDRKIHKLENLGFDEVCHGFDIADKFVIGYGLDWNQYFRTLDHITTARVETDSFGKICVPDVRQDPDYPLAA